MELWQVLEHYNSGPKVTMNGPIVCRNISKERILVEHSTYFVCMCLSTTLAKDYRSLMEPIVLRQPFRQLRSCHVSFG